jgi:hypothetical protein
MIYKASVLGMPGQNWPDAAVSPVPKLNGRLFGAIFEPQQQNDRKQYTKEKTAFTQQSPIIKAIHVNFTI